MNWRLILRKCDSIVFAISAVAILAMMLQITIDVGAKTLFHYPIPMTLELVSNYYMVAVIFLPLGVVTSRRAHIRVEIIDAILTDNVSRYVSLVADFIVFCVVALLSGLTFADAIRRTNINESIDTIFGNLPTWPARWLIPLGFILMSLHVIRSLMTNLRSDLWGN